MGFRGTPFYCVVGMEDKDHRQFRRERKVGSSSFSSQGSDTLVIDEDAKDHKEPELCPLIYELSQPHFALEQAGLL